MSHRWMKRLLIVALVLGLSLGLSELVEACPNCSTAVGNDDAAKGASVGTGYNYSIAVMMAVPYLIMGSFGFFIFRSFKKSLASQKAAFEAEQQQALEVESQEPVAVS